MMTIRVGDLLFFMALLPSPLPLTCQASCSCFSQCSASADGASDASTNFTHASHAKPLLDENRDYTSGCYQASLSTLTEIKTAERKDSCNGTAKSKIQLIRVIAFEALGRSDGIVKRC
jgi:hypothetical protein